MVLEDDLKCMKRVLRRLGFIDKEEIVQLKGRVACEISACDEIIVSYSFCYSLWSIGYRVDVFRSL